VLDWTGEGARPHMAGGEANMAGGDPDVSGDPHVRWRPTCPVETHMSGGDPHCRWRGRLDASTLICGGFGNSKLRLPGYGGAGDQND
jgi:hypothetical protein